MILIDTHAHLDFPKFKEDQAEVIQRAADAGVEYIFNIGADERSSKASVALAKKYPKIYAAIGVHPHDAKDMTGDTMRLLKDLAKEEKVRAIGEIGLDYHYDYSPRDVQQRAFRAQLRLAHDLKLPVIIHTREADTDTMKILREEEADKLGGIMHCFPGDLAMAEECIRMNFKIAFGGILTFDKETQAVVKGLPLEVMLLETDSPYLTPAPHRGEGVLIRENYYTDTVETTAYCRICLHYDPAHYYIYYWKTVCDYCGEIQSTGTTKPATYIDHVEEY